ncbi:hypothetical protein Raf01_90670 [Rugosimonospora africana]|uniref:Uncharacterized protein n=1 Tax=Rugosimonospora africana TaxID=556532 RepID=A0A8J3R0S8_9ACTN|nr:hypothetical protein Raf01_90670 [Rugosimonospora africana]
MIWDFQKPTSDDVHDLDAATNAYLEMDSRSEYRFRRADRDDKESPVLWAHPYNRSSTVE